MIYSDEAFYKSTSRVKNVFISKNYINIMVQI